MSLCTVSISVNDKPQGSFYGGSTTVPVFTNPYGTPSCNCEARIAQLEAMIKDLTDKFAKSLTVMPGLEVRRRENSIDCLSAVNPAVDPSAVFTNLTKQVSIEEEVEETTQYEGLASARAAAWRAEAEAGEQVVVESGPDEEEEEEEVEEMDVEEMDVEEQEKEKEKGVEEEEKEQEQEVVEEEEEESIEYLEVVYKGITYYRTEADNLVYSLDEDGEVSDDPIGVWSTEKNKLLKYPTQ
jgi:hypothetical protein